VNDDVRDRARAAEAREERDVALPTALENENPLLVRLDPERVEDERERQLLGAAFDEQHRPREEDLGAVGVELGEHAERLGLLERVGLEERRALVARMPDERQILDAIDAQEDRRVRRVEDLVAALGERAQQTEEMPLHVRAQVELGLLDQQHEAAQARRHEALHAHHELQSPVCLGPVMLGVRRLEELGHVGGAGAGGGSDERARAEVRRKEEHRRCTGAVEVERVRRARVEEDRRVLLQPSLEVDAPRRPTRDVVDRRRWCRRLEQRPDRRQHGRLPARRLADEDAHRPGLELELPCCAVPLDQDPAERGHVPT
jgi:hypothetical protein